MNLSPTSSLPVARPSLPPPPINFQRRRKVYVVASILLIGVVVVFASLFSVYLGAKVAPGKKFKILGPATLQAGQTATITWDASPENVKKYPFEKIEYCFGKLLKPKCVLLASAAPNKGQAVVKVPASLPAGTGFLKLTARDPSRKLLWAFTSKSGPVKVRPATTEVAESDGGGGSGGGGEANGSSPVAPPSGETGTTTQCPANSTEITFAANSETNDNARYTHTGPTGTYRIEMVSPEGLTDDEYANYTWANDPDYKQNRIHSGYFFVTKGELPRFENGRVANPTLSFGGAFRDPPYDNSRAAVANDTRGLDQQLTIATGDTLYFVVNGIQGQYGNYTGSIHVRICPEAITPSPTTALVPTTTPPGTSQNAPSGVHIAYSRYSRHPSEIEDKRYTLVYATNTLGSWTNVPAWYSPVRFGGISITADSANAAHISFSDNTTKNYNRMLKYATNYSGKWVVTTLDNVDNMMSLLYTAIATDNDNKIHISYGTWAHAINQGKRVFELRYITNSLGQWIKETIIPDNEVGPHDIAMDKNRKANIVFRNNGNLGYASNLNGNWQNELLTNFDGILKSVYFSNIEIDGHNKIHILFKQLERADNNLATPTKLKLIYRTNLSGRWVDTIVDHEITNITPEQYSMTRSIALDKQNKVHIVYVGTDLSIKYATNRTGEWVITILAQTSANFDYPTSNPEIAIDKNDNVHVLYMKHASLNQLIYMQKDDKNWKSIIIDQQNENSSPARGIHALAVTP